MKFALTILACTALVSARPSLEYIWRRAGTPGSASVCANGIMTSQVCVAVNIPSEADAKNDIFLKVTGPSTKQYTGIGFSGSMTNCLMLLIFPNVKQDNISVSMRLSSGHVKPALANSTIIAELMSDSTSDATIFTANVRCRNCRSWMDGSINVRGAQDFIYAYGATSTTGLSGDQAVTTYHGPFSRGVLKLNLAAANGPGQVPMIDPAKRQ